MERSLFEKLENGAKVAEFLECCPEVKEMIGWIWESPV